MNAVAETDTSFCNFLEFYSSTTITLPLKSIEEKKESFVLYSESLKNDKKAGYECASIYDAIGMVKIKETAGANISLRGINFKAYSTLPATEFSCFSAASDDGAKSFFNFINQSRTDIASGINLNMKDFFKANIPIKIYSGMISYSRSVSSLKNPEFSSLTNALKSSFGHPTGLGASLPSTAATIRPISNSIQFNPDSFTFECACFDDSQFLFSTTFYLLHKNLIKSELNFSGGRFYLEEKETTSWFRQTKSFAPQWYDAYLLDLKFSIPRVKTQFSVGVHQNPFGNFRYWIRNENRFIFGCILLDSCFFASDNYISNNEYEGIITVDSNILQTVAQAKINPQFQHRLGLKNILLRTGISSAIEIKRQNIMPIEELQMINLAAATELSSSKSSIESSFKIEDIPYKETNTSNTTEPKQVFALQASHSFSKIKISSKMSISRATSNSENFSIYVYLPTHFVSLVSCSTTKTHSSSETSQTSEIALSLKKTVKKIRFNGKISLNIQM